MKTSTRVLLGMMGVSGLLLSLPCIASMGYELAIGVPNADMSLFFLVFMMILAIPSMFAVYKALKSPSSTHIATANTASLNTVTASQNEEQTERIILRMARIRHGRLSPTHVAMQTPLTIDQATHALDQLERRGLIYSEVTIHGGNEFVFPDLLPPTTEFEQFDHKLAEENHILDLESSQQKEEKQEEQVMEESAYQVHQANDSSILK